MRFSPASFFGFSAFGFFAFGSFGFLSSIPASSHSRSYRALSSFALAQYGALSSSDSSFHAAPISLPRSAFLASGFAALNSSRFSAM